MIDSESTVKIGAFSWWILGVGFFVNVVGWFVQQFFIIEGLDWPGMVSPILSCVQSFSILIPAYFLITHGGSKLRSVWESWAGAALVILLLAPFGSFAVDSISEVIIGQTIGLGLIVLALVWRKGAVPFRWNIAELAPMGLVGLPWVLWGALGSGIDLLFGSLWAVFLAYIAWRLIRWGSIEAAVEEEIWEKGWLRNSGYVAGVTLFILGSGIGFSGGQLLFGLAWPAIGWLVVALMRWDNGWGLVLLVGTIAFPLLLVDPDEVQMILGSEELLSWAFKGAWLTVFLGWIVGYLFSRMKGEQFRKYQSLGLALGGGTFSLLFLAYFIVGQPGFYGEHLFILMEEQADLSGAEQIDDYLERKEFVYQSLVEHAESDQQLLRVQLERWGIEYQPFYLINGIEVEGGSLIAWWLSRQPGVGRVVKNPILRPLPRLPHPAVGTEAEPDDGVLIWNLEMIEANRVWEEFGVTGEGVVVGNSDSGVQWDHPALIATYRGKDGNHQYNWFDAWDGSEEPFDIAGHGTHTMGTIVGDKIGVAPGATWYACANLIRNLANPALYLECMQFMLAPFPTDGDPFKDGDVRLGADVLNNSWGCPPIEGCDATILLDGVRALRTAGIFIVASAGNEGGVGCSSVSSPIALYDEVFSVGAIDSVGELTEFSSLGPVTADGSDRIKPDIVAPGRDILSSYPGGGYEENQGTSMAGPHLVGVVALIWSANPALKGKVAETELILQQTADRYKGGLPSCVTSGHPNNGVGYGVVNAYEAVKAGLEK